MNKSCCHCSNWIEKTEQVGECAIKSAAPIGGTNWSYQTYWFHACDEFAAKKNTWHQHRQKKYIIIFHGDYGYKELTRIAAELGGEFLPAFDFRIGEPLSIEFVKIPRQGE